MSRIGKKPIDVPSGVNVTINGRDITVQGAKGTLTYAHRPEVSVSLSDDKKQIVVERLKETGQHRAYHGMTRALLNNMVVGVSQGFTRELEISGVGWTAQLQGQKLTLNIGYAFPRVLEVPMGLDVQVNGQRITISGPDKQAVGQFAAATRSQRPPEPYNAKGIKYSDEVVVRKEGKAFAGGAG
jgi:large subunit ribosomal protein L6